MLVKLEPEQVVNYWDFISHALKESLPSGFTKVGDNLSQILESLLIGNMQCWFLVKEIPDDFELLACIVTRSYIEPTTYVKIFTIFSMYGFDVTQLDLWRSGYEKLIKYAKETGHDCVDAYFDDEQILAAVKYFNWTTRHYCYLEL